MNVQNIPTTSPIVFTPILYSIILLKRWIKYHCLCWKIIWIFMRTISSSRIPYFNQNEQLFQWMNEWVNGWVNGWMNEYFSKRVLCESSDKRDDTKFVEWIFNLSKPNLMEPVVFSLTKLRIWVLEIHDFAYKFYEIQIWWEHSDCEESCDPFERSHTWINYNRWIEFSI